jgi:hypothetical protein
VVAATAPVTLAVVFAIAIAIAADIARLLALESGAAIVAAGASVSLQDTGAETDDRRADQDDLHGIHGRLLRV